MYKNEIISNEELFYFKVTSLSINICMYVIKSPFMRDSNVMDIWTAKILVNSNFKFEARSYVATDVVATVDVATEDVATSNVAIV